MGENCTHQALLVAIVCEEANCYPEKMFEILEFLK
jgi:hypothetical protein